MGISPPHILTVWVSLSSYVLFNVPSLATRVPDPLLSAMSLWHSSLVRHRLLLTPVTLPFLMQHRVISQDRSPSWFLSVAL